MRGDCSKVTANNESVLSAISAWTDSPKPVVAQKRVMEYKRG